MTCSKGGPKSFESIGLTNDFVDRWSRQHAGLPSPVTSDRDSLSPSAAHDDRALSRSRHKSYRGLVSLGFSVSTMFKYFQRLNRVGTRSLKKEQLIRNFGRSFR